MGEKLREILKGKNIINIVVLFALGVGLLLFSQFGLNNEEERQEPIPTIIREPGYSDLERRLSSAFSRIEGAGEVHILLNFASTPSVFARDVNQNETNISEQDAGGGMRNQQTTSTIANYVLNGGLPLILQESEMIVAGIIIIAEGGGNIHVVESLTNAARSLLGIEPHRISVLEMSVTN